MEEIDAIVTTAETDTAQVTEEAVSAELLLERKLFTDMFKKQFKFNNETLGTGWLKGVTKNDDPIDWRICLRKKIGEFINCFNCGPQENIDIELFKTEMIDIWQSIMSEIIILSINEKSELNLAERNEALVTEDDLEQMFTEIGDNMNILSYKASMPDEELDWLMNNNILIIIKSMYMHTRHVMDDIAHFFGIIILLEANHSFNREDLYKLHLSKINLAQVADAE